MVPVGSVPAWTVMPAWPNALPAQPSTRHAASIRNMARPVDLPDTGPDARPFPAYPDFISSPPYARPAFRRDRESVRSWPACIVHPFPSCSACGSKRLRLLPAPRHSRAAALRMARHASRPFPSASPHEVEEPALVVVVEVGQVVAELGEVVANADPEVPADVTVDAHQPAGPGATVPDVEPAVLG